ncbi:MAG TPA: ATP-binding protein [Syntrophales bacterium]|nr:ATP-binding protein [Syntrophales bacterium]
MKVFRKKERRQPEIGPQEARRRKRERIIIFLAMLVIVVLSLLESHLFQRDGALSLSSNVLIFGMININIILIILLVFLIVRNVVKLIFERRRGVIGSKLRTKLVVAFVGLSLIPTVLLFLVSINFLSYSIDNWFSIRIGQALNKTLELAQKHYQQTGASAKDFARQISSEITRNRLYEREKRDYLKALIEQRQKSHHLGALEVYIDNRREKMFASNPDIPEDLHINLSPKMLEDLFIGKEVSAVQQVKSGDLISGMAPIYSVVTPQTVVGAVLVSYYVPQSYVDDVQVISRTSEQYRQLNLFKNPVKMSFIITLFIVTLLIIFSATWFGLFLAKGITGPIQDLAEATKKIAQGDLNQRIEVVADDEIGVLVDSFNSMMKDLKRSKSELEQANVDLEQRRKYMETVLRNVSAGVVSVDRDGVIVTINQAAERLLSISTEKVLNRRYEEVLIPEHNQLVREILQQMKESGESYAERQLELMLKDRALTLLTAISVLKDEEGNDMGMVIVFEDLTQLQMAERAAVWREVARRMAHDIKNPLTPIQLSAQRLQKKYGQTLGEEGAVFQECTQTIINQVDVLKRLVNEFSRYSRMPITKLALHDLNETIGDSVSLFQDAHKEIRFVFEQGTGIPRLNLDPEQIRRVMVNLLDNAVAAIDKNEGCIEIRTSLEDERRRVRVEIADNGCGVLPANRTKVFEPYFSTKGTGGTGLGLAIVRSIISDHRGVISVRDNTPSGTVVSFELPVPEATA